MSGCVCSNFLASTVHKARPYTYTGAYTHTQRHVSQCQRNRCIVLAARWPWPLFKLLVLDETDVTLFERQTLAKGLEEDPEKLEATTLKIRRRCEADLQNVASTGKLQQASCLHGLLTITALQLKLDAGSLESLNSMIKTSVSVANNTRMSLELLSSRVNMRKTISIETGGKTRLADVRPVAEALARSAVVYQHCEKDVLRTDFRWKPPDPKQLVHADVRKHNPALSMTAAQRWAVKYNSTLLKAAHAWRHAHTGDTGLLLTVQFGEDQQQLDQDEETRPQMFVLAELCGRSAWLVRLRRQAASGQDGFNYVLSPKMEFVSSLDAVAAQQLFLRGSRKRALSLAVLGWRHEAADEGSSPGILVFQATQTLSVSHLRKTRSKTTRPVNPAADDAADAAAEDSPESDGSGEDRAWNEEAATTASPRICKRFAHVCF